MAKLKPDENRLTIRPPSQGEPFIRPLEPYYKYSHTDAMCLIAFVKHPKIGPSSKMVSAFRIVNNPPREGELRMARRLLKEWFVREVRRLTGKPEKRFWPHWRTIFKEQDGETQAR